MSFIGNRLNAVQVLRVLLVWLVSRVNKVKSAYLAYLASMETLVGLAALAPLDFTDTQGVLDRLERSVLQDVQVHKDFRAVLAYQVPLVWSDQLDLRALKVQKV